MLDLLTAAPKVVAFGDKTYKLGALKLKEIGLLQRWIRDHAVHPADALTRRLPLLPPEEHRQAQIEAIRAEEDWPPTVGSSAGNKVLFEDLDGITHFVGVMFRKYQPGISDDEVDGIVRGIDNIALGALSRIAFGDDDLDPAVAYREAKEMSDAAAKTARERMIAVLKGLLAEQGQPPDGSVEGATGSTSLASTGS